MPDMKLTAEVLLRIEGHEELHNIGTMDVPINITFDKKPRPGMRSAEINVKVNEDQLSRNIERQAARSIPGMQATMPKPTAPKR